MFKIKKDDTVVVLKGRDRGKTGKVLKIFTSCGKPERALVQGIQIVKRHLKKRKQDEPAGIVEKEAPINVSNIAPLCSKCKKPARVGFKIEDSKSSQSGSSILAKKIRYCKKCKEAII
ncbi:50S ribosomal protein L24 [bacterium Unc6]|nr:50S ribosomal protein L24 [bacterium Unc6]